MSAGDSISSLIADIYGAALDASRWAEVLGNAANYIGGSAAGIWMRNPNLASAHQYHFGGDDEFREPIFARYQESVRRVPRHCSAVADVAVADAHVAEPIEYLETRLGQRPNKCISRFAVYRHRRSDAWDETALGRMRHVGRHLRRAVMISKLIGIRRAAAAAMADTLDGLSAGVIFVDANGETVHANARGRAMLAEGRLLRSVRGKLIAKGFDALSAVGELVTAGSGCRSRLCVAEGGVAPGAAGGETYVAQVFPVAADARRRTDCNPAVAGIVLREAHLNTPDAVARIARHYRLAPRECEVLEAIAEGSGLAETAERLAIAPSTMKTYLRRLFEKTGTSRQIDLVKLCAAFHSPFSG